ncbi:MAG TPA: hypothetical protein VK638_37600 [Edaphobacter sp.]|nr:hypothetical protein [Edaphobacter sp.]
MTLYSYVVSHDFGFAPNPFHGVCTLATCKPAIRKNACVGDYVVGTGCAKRNRQGYLVYFMLISETITFDQYWTDQRYQVKKPNLRSSIIYAFGDNIYHRAERGKWVQEKSVHSYENGRSNPVNIRTDTKSDRVLIATDFLYFGRAGPEIPEQFRKTKEQDICGKRYYRKNLSPDLVANFIGWLRQLGTQGYAGDPLDWRTNWATKTFMSDRRRKEISINRNAWIRR